MYKHIMINYGEIYFEQGIFKNRDFMSNILYFNF